MPDKRACEDKLACEQELERLRSDDALPLSDYRPETGRDAESRFFRIDRITSEKNSSQDQALENVYTIFRHAKARLLWHLVGDGRKVSCHLGVMAPRSSVGKLFDALKSAFCGNFRGADVQDVPAETVLTPLCSNFRLRFSSMRGVPTKFSGAENRKFQSLDRVIHAMAGRPFHLCLIWESIEAHALDDMERRLRSIYGKIVPLAVQQGSKSETNTKTVAKETVQTSDSCNTTTLDKGFLIWQKALDEELLPRVRLGMAKGMYQCATYLAAEDEDSLHLLESSLSSVFQGDVPSCAPLFSRAFPQGSRVGEAIAGGRFFMHPCEAGWLCLRSRLLHNGSSALATALTAAELGFLAGMPRADVPGLAVTPRVSFGLNIPARSQGVTLGPLLQDGGELEEKVRLNYDDLERHLFIAGTTGAGKTTTCHRILHETNCGFLVLEPAKTEYRCLAADPKMRDLLVFTPGDENAAPFRLNPFEFLRGEKISSHVDMLKACFMASFTMEAAMPNLLEEAMYRLYDRFGWDIGSNSNRFLGPRTPQAWEEKERGRWFPTINDFIQVLVTVVKDKNFGERLENEYIGSLRGRLESLTVGAKGRMFNTRRSLDFSWLLGQKVVIELEELKSGEDKAFTMALIVGRLLEALKLRYREPGFHHILLLEEAHRLLTRLDFLESPCRRMGVEIFTDMLAEVRKYHECLMIVDQIPAKLAPEVLKNTNTKIVHRIFAEDDKRAIGETMALSEEQRDFLSQLPTGHAIIYGNGWTMPVHMRVELLASKVHDTADALGHSRDFWEQHKTLFCPPFPNDGKATPTQHKLGEMCDMAQKAHELLRDMERNQDMPSDKVKRWRQFVNYALRKSGATYGQAFLANVLEDALLARELTRNEGLDFDLAKELASIRKRVPQLLSADDAKMRYALDSCNLLICEGD